MTIIIDAQHDDLVHTISGITFEIVNIPEDQSELVYRFQKEADEFADEARTMRSRIAELENDLFVERHRATESTFYGAVPKAVKLLRDIAHGDVYSKESRIYCIKLVRTITGLCIKDARDLVEAVLSGTPLPSFDA